MFKLLAGKMKWGFAVASVMSAMLLATPAKAVIYTGSWDPAFGSAFPDLGWRGEATFFVPDACRGISGLVSNFNPCSSLGMKILSAEVEFYKLSDPNNAAFQETLLFDVASDAVLAMRIEGGALTGVLGTFLYSVASTLPLAGGPYTDFALIFQDDLARLAFVSDPPNGKKTIGISDANPPVGGAPFITFRIVPEPGTLALFLAGFAAIALGLRQRRRVLPDDVQPA